MHICMRQFSIIINCSQENFSLAFHRICLLSLSELKEFKAKIFFQLYRSRELNVYAILNSCLCNLNVLSFSFHIFIWKGTHYLQEHYVVGF